MTLKITEAVAEEVVRLHDNQTDASEIAQRLNLKKAQVTAIIAYSRPDKGPDGPVSAAIAEANGGGEHSAESEDSTDRSQLIEEYSADPEAEPEAAVAPTEERVDRLSDEKDERNDGILVGTETEYGDAQYWNPQDSAAVTKRKCASEGEALATGCTPDRYRQRPKGTSRLSMLAV